MKNQKDSWGNFWRLSVLSVGIALLATMILLAGQRWVVARHHLLEALQTNAQIFGANASAALAFDDRETATEILSALTHSPMVTEAALYMPDGHQLARYKKEAARPGFAPAVFNPDEGVVVTPPGLRQSLKVTVGGNEVGVIVLWAVMDGVQRELKEFLVGYAATAVVAALLAYLAGYRLRQRLADNQQELAQSEATIRLLAARRDKLVEDEHKRIAREIHDELGQIMTASLMRLKQLGRQLNSGKQLSVSQVEEIEAMIAEAMKSVRNIAADLRPAVLNIGFQAAIEWLAERMLTSNGIRFRIHLPEVMPDLGEDVLTALFRITQESLTNVVRHSRATMVTISLLTEEDVICLEIVDDGVGFASPAAGAIRSLGLVGMRERAAALGAGLEITSHLGQGTQVRVFLPRENLS